MTTAAPQPPPPRVRRRPFGRGLSISESVAVSGPGEWIHVSGQIPTDAEDEVLSGSMREQAASCFDGLDAALQRAGSQLADIVKITVFLTDLATLGELNEVRGERLGEKPPASSAVQVAALYGGAQLEIEAVAFKPAVTDGS